MKCNLKRLLFDRDMSQMDLHRKTGIRYETVNWYYHSLIKRMNVKDLETICTALNCKLSELIELDPNVSK
jgi:putative transcriptional regulator